MNKRLVRIWQTLKLWPRLSLLEAHAGAVKETFGAMQVCIDCGAVMYAGHPRVSKLKIADDEYEIRCKWDAAAYERSELARTRARKAKVEAVAAAQVN